MGIEGKCERQERREADCMIHDIQDDKSETYELECMSEAQGIDLEGG